MPFLPSTLVATFASAFGVLPSQHLPLFPGDIDFGSLTRLDASLTLLDDSDAIMAYDFGYGQFFPPAKTPYKTITSNPMFMSFADPSTTETALASKSSAQSPNQNAGNPYDVTFGQWTGQTSTGSLDELLGGYMFGTQALINFNALMKNSVTSPVTSAMSPVAHQSVPSSSNGPSSSASPSFEPSDASSPPAAPGSHGDGCPKTRAQMEKHIQAAGSSMFAQFLRQAALSTRKLKRRRLDATTASSIASFSRPSSPCYASSSSISLDYGQEDSSPSAPTSSEQPTAPMTTTTPPLIARRSPPRSIIQPPSFGGPAPQTPLDDDASMREEGEICENEDPPFRQPERLIPAPPPTV
ncbi:hypothetical protein BGW80DRAFT_1248675 [Lactifluus volemus]|nr:hypothetical protein BGW80DRAFT_1248675 [Lactifluus volemus]